MNKGEVASVGKTGKGLGWEKKGRGTSGEMTNGFNANFKLYISVLFKSDGFFWTMIIFSKNVWTWKTMSSCCARHDLLIFFGDTLVASNECTGSGQESYF